MLMVLGIAFTIQAVGAFVAALGSYYFREKYVREYFYLCRQIATPPPLSWPSARVVVCTWVLGVYAPYLSAMGTLLSVMYTHFTPV